MTSSASVTTLPPLNADERAHSERVVAHIRAFMRERGGVIGFDAWMRLALYAPGLGYYSAGATKLGASGDFVTAPEVSEPVFALPGAAVRRRAARDRRRRARARRRLRPHGGGHPHRARCARLPARRDTSSSKSARISPSASARGSPQLPRELSARVQWLDRWPERNMRGVVLANEVLDAMPVERFVLRGRPGGIDVRALGVGLDRGGRSNGARPRRRPSSCTRWPISSRRLPAPLPDGYVSEVCLAFQPWIASLAAQLEEGVALLIDYGLPRAHLYHPDRAAGTLRCHFRHRAHDDPFINVGLQDITAWVDFTRVAEAADSAGLEVLGFASQAAFLIGAGMESLLTTEMQIAGDDARAQAQLAGEARRLMLPGEMGEIFKVIALGRGYESPLAGFSTQTLAL